MRYLVMVGCLVVGLTVVAVAWFTRPEPPSFQELAHTICGDARGLGSDRDRCWLARPDGGRLWVEYAAPLDAPESLIVWASTKWAGVATARAYVRATIAGALDVDQMAAVARGLGRILPIADSVRERVGDVAIVATTAPLRDHIVVLVRLER